MRVYAVNRPFDLFTYPKQYEYTERVDFKQKQYVEEIGRHAWGYIDYIDDIPQEELDRYELVTPKSKNTERQEQLERYAEHIAFRISQGWDSQVERLFEQGVEMFGFDEEELDTAVGKALKGASRA